MYILVKYCTHTYRNNSTTECKALLRWKSFFLQKYLKYKVIQKSEDELYSFNEAVRACQDIGAELWEVRLNFIH